ncbi:hypothetical protein HWC08_gp025 [Lactobacillus phage 521B]|uniref:Uncharacterized protein n=1 Tax=Lactobacillus phage 521B TaxID=2510942 RepID=A0A4Y5FEC4_9CAUD|nr:hypothetical protein HWC08_gp025 [Lactobacillus phage 521B]QBJ03375.1 hypothetical protein B521_0025 [Lactobacillus phage 521B]
MGVDEAYSEFDKKFKDNADKVNGVDLDSLVRQVLTECFNEAVPEEGKLTFNGRLNPLLLRFINFYPLEKSSYKLTIRRNRLDILYGGYVIYIDMGFGNYTIKEATKI